MKHGNRIVETTTTTGTGTYSRAGAVSGYQAFSELGVGETCHYLAKMGSVWEIGLGTITADGLERTTIIESSTGSVIDWAAGEKTLVQTLLGQTIDDLDLTGLLDETAHDALDHTGLTGVPAAYTHPTGDGNLHVPATSTTNSGKVLTAGATAGALSWETPSGGGDSYAPGDILITGDTDKTTPEWVDAEGQTLELGVYPDLDLLFSDSAGADKMANPATLPPNVGYGTVMLQHLILPSTKGQATLSPSWPTLLPYPQVMDSEQRTYLAVGHATTPYITIYKRSGDTFTKLANPATLPPNVGYGTAFSPDGTYLAVSHTTTPFITIYKRSGDTFTKVADPATLPAGTGNGTAFSPDGTYLAVSHNNSPFITIYKRSGDTFTKVANPATLPAGTGRGTAFSPDGTYLAVSHNNSPFITIYKRSGDTFTKLANPATLPAGTGLGTAFSPDGTYLAVSHNNSPFITIYKRSGDTFTKLTNPATLPTSNGNGTAFSPDGTYLAVGHEVTPFVTIYKSEKTLLLPDLTPTDTRLKAKIYTGETA